MFAIPALDQYHVFVSDPEQISEVSDAPLTQLSFNAAIDEVGQILCLCSSYSKLKYWQQFSPHLLFNGFKFDSKDPRYVVPLHALTVQLRDNLQALVPTLQKRLDCIFEAALPNEKCRDS